MVKKNENFWLRFETFQSETSDRIVTRLLNLSAHSLTGGEERTSSRVTKTFAQNLISFSKVVKTLVDTFSFENFIKQAKGRNTLITDSKLKPSLTQQNEFSD